MSSEVCDIDDELIFLQSVKKKGFLSYESGPTPTKELNLDVKVQQPDIRSKLESLHRQSFVWALRCSAQDVAMAEEAMQNVYLKVLEGRAAFHGKSSFKTWLFAVIRLTVLDMRRNDRLRSIRRTRYNREVDGQEQVPPEADHRIGEFKDKVGQLPGRQQEVLDLHFYHDLTLKEIAGVLDISVGSVRQHYDRGKRKLRILLSNESSIDEE